MNWVDHKQLTYSHLIIKNLSLIFDTSLIPPFNSSHYT